MKIELNYKLTIFSFILFIFFISNFSNLVLQQESSAQDSSQQSSYAEITKSISNTRIPPEGSAIVTIIVTPLENQVLKNVSIFDAVPRIFDIQPSNIANKNNEIYADISHIEKEYRFIYSITPKPNMTIQGNWNFTLPPAILNYKVQNNNNTFPPEYSPQIKDIQIISDAKWYQIWDNVWSHVIFFLSLAIISGFFGGVVNYKIGPIPAEPPNGEDQQDEDKFESKSVELSSQKRNLKFKVEYDDNVPVDQFSRVSILCSQIHPPTKYLEDSTEVISCKLFIFGKDSKQTPLIIVPDNQSTSEFQVKKGANLRILFSSTTKTTDKKNNVEMEDEPPLVIHINVQKLGALSTLRENELAGIAAGLVVLFSLFVINQTNYPLTIFSLIQLIVLAFISGFAPFQIINAAISNLKTKVSAAQISIQKLRQERNSLLKNLKSNISNVEFLQKDKLPVYYKKEEKTTNVVPPSAPPDLPTIDIENSVNYALILMKEQKTTRIIVQDKPHNREYILDLKDVEFIHMNKKLTGILEIMEIRK